ncbi:transcription elongation factor GreA [Candidatus Falkowbacteria bacterium]|nr:transcription elongation factor GreA [Candidatus Falkowbacteria bacterium]
MQIPKRKPSKYANQEQDPHITPAKFSELKRQLEKLKNVSQPQAIEETKRLASLGDFSENAEYQLAKGRLRGINNRMLEIEEYLKRAVIIESHHNADRVSLGSTVTVEVNGQHKTYQILGSSETDPSQGIISQSSPLGSALLGKRLGETVTVPLAKNMAEYTIVRIE